MVSYTLKCELIQFALKGCFFFFFFFFFFNSAFFYKEYFNGKQVSNADPDKTSRSTTSDLCFLCLLRDILYYMKIGMN